MIMHFSVKYSLYWYACIDFSRPPANTIHSIFSPNSMICVETLTIITVLQEALRLCQSAFAGGKPCDWLFYPCSFTYIPTANKDRNFRIWAFNPFSRKGLVAFCLVVWLLSRTMWLRNNFAPKQKSDFFSITMSWNSGGYFSLFMSLPLFKKSLN